MKNSHCYHNDKKSPAMVTCGTGGHSVDTRHTFTNVFVNLCTLQCNCIFSQSLLPSGLKEVMTWTLQVLFINKLQSVAARCGYVT